MTGIRQAVIIMMFMAIFVQRSHGEVGLNFSAFENDGAETQFDWDFIELDASTPVESLTSPGGTTLSADESVATIGFSDFQDEVVGQWTIQTASGNTTFNFAPFTQALFIPAVVMTPADGTTVTSGSVVTATVNDGDFSDPNEQVFAFASATSSVATTLVGRDPTAYQLDLRPGFSEGTIRIDVQGNNFEPLSSFTTSNLSGLLSSEVNFHSPRRNRPTITVVRAVPEPSSFFFAAGLVAMATLRRRRSR